MMPTAFVPQPPDAELRKCQKKYRGKKTANAWKMFRADDSCGERAVKALMIAYGTRCVYCDHAHGWTIDHAKPKSAKPEIRFSWGNWRLSCMDCNNKKGNKRVVDPIHEDPRDFIEFDLVTGGPVVVGSGRKRAAAVTTRGLLDNQTLNDARRAARGRMVDLLRRVVGRRAGAHVEVSEMLDRGTPHRAILRDLVLEMDPALNPDRAVVDAALAILPMLTAWAHHP